MYKNFLLPVGLLSGTIIGAGVFSLPYIFNKSGFGAGFFYLLVGVLAYGLVHLMYADIILRTKEERRFVGYAREYLGGWAFWASILMAVVQMIFVLTIYLVLSVSFLNLMTGFGTGVEKLLLFWFIGSLCIFLSLKRLAFLEFLITGGIAIIILFIFILGIPELGQFDIYKISASWENFILPLAPVLFAISGRVAIPSLVNYFRSSWDAFSLVRLKRAIVWGTVFPALVYVLFVMGVLVLSPNISEDAVTGLISVLDNRIISVIGFLGILSIFSSYIVVGLDIKNILVFDLKFPKILTFALVVFAPLLPYFLGFKSFIGLISFVGGIFLALEGIFIALMWLRANKLTIPPVILKSSPIFLIIIVLAVFGSALIYEAVKYV